MARLLINLFPLVLVAVTLATSPAFAADNEDPTKALEGLLKPDASSPLGGTLTGLQYTGYGLSHVKKDGVDASSIVQGAGQGVVQQAAHAAKGAEPAVSSDLASSAASTEDSLGATEDSAKVPSADGVATAAKQAGDAVYVPGGTLSSSLGQRAQGPQIDGMDIVSLGGKQPDAKDVAAGVTGVAKTAAGVALSPYIGTVRTGVSTAGAVVQGADGAFGAAKQAVQQAQQAQQQQQQQGAAGKKQGKRVYTPAIALFPGAGPEANELSDQIKNTLGLPTPDTSAQKSQGAGQKRFNHSKAGRRHQQ